MSIGGLNWNVLNWPFGFGLGQKTDPRARPAPVLDIARDVQVDEHGGLQTRYPYVALSDEIAGGGTIANCRRMFVSGSELCLLTDDALYTYDEQLTQWVVKATHVAVAVDESPVFISTGDQIETDRAELSGRIYYAWTDTSKVYVAIVDKATGSVWLGPPRWAALVLGRGWSLSRRECSCSGTQEPTRSRETSRCTRSIRRPLIRPTSLRTW